jgi:hypothetical protein
LVKLFTAGSSDFVSAGVVVFFSAEGSAVFFPSIWSRVLFAFIFYFIQNIIELGIGCKRKQGYKYNKEETWSHFVFGLMIRRQIYSRV